MPRIVQVVGTVALLAGVAVAQGQTAPSHWSEPGGMAPAQHAAPSPYAPPSVRLTVPAPPAPDARYDVTRAAYETPLAAPTDPTAAAAEAPVNRSPPAEPLPLGRRASEPPLPLAPPGQAAHESDLPSGGLPSMITLAGSLAMVLAAFFAVMWLVRRTAPAGAMPLPAGVVEVLGRAPLTGRQQMHLLRCGSKLLLVSVTPEGAETLTEITDPEEVDRLAGLCQQARPNSATAAFRHVLHQFAGGESRDG